MSAKDKTATLLEVLPVQEGGPKGTCDTFELLDDGSTCTQIETAIANKIGVAGTPASFFIEGVAAHESTNRNTSTSV